MVPGVEDERAYAHLLGLYLGDGCLWVAPRTVQLQLSLDARYPGLIDDCRRTMSRVAPGRRTSVRKRRDANCVVVSSYWQGWAELFPQHGPGPKHRRPIELAPWHERIVEDNEWEFVVASLKRTGAGRSTAFG